MKSQQLLMTQPVLSSITAVELTRETAYLLNRSNMEQMGILHPEKSSELIKSTQQGLVKFTITMGCFKPQHGLIHFLHTKIYFT